MQMKRRVLSSLIIFLSIITLTVLFTKIQTNSQPKKNPRDFKEEEESLREVISDFERSDFPIAEEEKKIPPAVTSWEVNGPSDKWLPIKLDFCKGLNPLSAPCIKSKHPNSNLIEAYELIYKPFRIRLPMFVNQEHKSRWQQKALETDRYRLSNDGVWADYPTFYGQNMVFKNAAYKGKPIADAWVGESCMGGAESALSFFEETKEKPDVDTLVIATVPDSYSFQHFLDRVTVVWSQGLLSIPDKDRESAAIVSGRSPSANVNRLYELMGAKTHFHGKHVSASKLVFSCRSPLIHPFVAQRFNDLIGVKRDTVPLSQKKIVLMMARGQGDEHNSGRRILNQGQVNDAVQNLLDRRGLDEKLVQFKSTDYDSIDDVIKFMQNEVSAIIGPHGAALYNGRFLGTGTLVYEVMPANKFAVMFWEQSRLLEQNYAVYMANDNASFDDMTVEDIDGFIRVLEQNLGKHPIEAPLLENYNRNVE